jgi:hypothetical protein
MAKQLTKRAGPGSSNRTAKQEEDGTPRVQPHTAPVRPLCWESFFHCQRSPVLRSQMLTALMAGTKLIMERVPTPGLLDALLLSTATRHYCDAEIIDDYDGLLVRTAETWKRPDWSTKVFSSMHANAANFILLGTKEFNCAEDAYIPGMVEWYLSQEPPQYFARELTEDDIKKVKRAA